MCPAQSKVSGRCRAAASPGPRAAHEQASRTAGFWRWPKLPSSSTAPRPVVAVNDPVNSVALRLEHIVETVFDQLAVAVEELVVHVDGL